MDFGLATLLGAGLSATGGLFGNLINRNIARENLKYMQIANEQNIAFQKQENEITRQREDNAVTRASIDMQNAGLSKTLAAGHPASAQALTAPQQQSLNNQFKYESALQKLNLAQTLQNMVVQKESIAQNWARIENETKETNARVENFQFQNASLEAKTELDKIVGSYKSDEIKASIDYTMAQIGKVKSGILVDEALRDKYKQEISESIAREYNLSKEGEILVKKIVSQEIDNLTASWNLSRNMFYGTPTNYSPSTIGKLGRDFQGAIEGGFCNDFYIDGLNNAWR